VPTLRGTGRIDRSSGPGIGADLAPRQRELGRLLAELLVADFRAFPPSTVNSPAGPNREDQRAADDAPEATCAG